MERQSIPKDVSIRLNVLFLVLFLALCLLVARVAKIQLMDGVKYASAAEANRYAQQILPAPRGQMKDRNGQVLVANKAAFSIQFINADDTITKQIPQVAKKLEGLLLDPSQKKNLTAAEIEKIMRAGDIGGRAQPRSIQSDATELQVAHVKEHLEELPGIQVVPEAVRDYRLKTFASHAIGYLNSITAETWKDYKDNGYLMTDKVGITGLEKQYESYLRGTHGATQVDVNIHGDPVNKDAQKTLIKNPIPGNDLILGIDKSLQEATEKALQERVDYLKTRGVKHAAAVAMNPNTGEVLAMASYPAFDPNHWLNGISPENYKLFQPAEFNYAAEYPIPPGSSVKMATTMIGLKEGVIKPDEKLFDSGVTDIYGYAAKSWDSGLGWSNGKEAIAKSSNSFMFNVAMRLAQHNKIGAIGMKAWMEQYDKPAVQKFQNYQKQFGLGVKTGIDLPYEATGNWNYGEMQTINLPFMAIGQNSAFTPMQLLQYVSTIANGGNRMRPYLVKEIRDPNGNLIKKTEPQVLNKIDFTPEQIQYARDGMWQVTHEPYGTISYLLKDKKYNVAGKTGTSENGSTENFWFVGYAPFENPQIAIAVVVPDGPVGAHTYEVAGPIVTEMLDTYFKVPDDQRTKYAQ